MSYNPRVEELERSDSYFLEEVNNIKAEMSKIGIHLRNKHTN